MNVYAEKLVALKDARMRIQSDRVLQKVAKTLIKERALRELAFPHSVRTSDLGYRFQLMARRLSNRIFESGVPLSANQLSEGDRAESVAGYLREQMHVVLGQENNTLTLQVEAADQSTAMRIAQLITNTFVEETYMRDRREMLRKEEYLERTILTQQHKINLIEEKMRAINKRYPGISFNALQGPARQSSVALKFSKLKSELVDIGDQLKTNQLLMSKYRSLLDGFATSKHVDLVAMRVRLLDEINELELKRIEYTRVLGYPDQHPSIIENDRRIKRLKEVYGDIQKQFVSSVQNGDAKQPFLASRRQLEEGISDTSKKIEELMAKKQHLSGTLSKQSSTFEDGLQVESEAAGLIRDLTAHIEIVTTLRKHLEDLRVQMVGAVDSATIIAKPTLPVNPVSLTTDKRGLFGTAVGATLVISLLFLLDLARPRFWVFEDLDAIGLKHFGAFSQEYASIVRFTSSLLSLSNNAESDGAGCRVALFSVVSNNLSVEPWLGEVCRTLQSFGSKAMLLVVAREEVDQRFSAVEVKNLQTCYCHTEELPFIKDRIFKKFKEDHDWVLVLNISQTPSPTDLLLRNEADQVFHVSKFGKSHMKDLKLAGDPTSKDHALVFEH